MSTIIASSLSFSVRKMDKENERIVFVCKLKFQSYYNVARLTLSRYPSWAESRTARSAESLAEIINLL